MTTAYQKVAGVYKQAAQAAKGTSDEPNALLQLASAAQSANDVTHRDHGLPAVPQARAGQP